MIKKTCALLVSVVVGGCTTTTTDLALTPQTISRLESKTVVISSHEQPAFIAAMAGKTMYGMVGVAPQLSSGRKIVEQHSIEDPAPRVARALAAALEQRFNMTVEPEQLSAPLTTNSLRKITKRFATFDYVIDVYTKDWTFQYYPGNFDRYRVRYSAKFRLIDIKDNSVIAQGNCLRDPMQSEYSPTYDQLLANNAALIKSELEEAAVFCADEFKSKVLAI